MKKRLWILVALAVLAGLFAGSAQANTLYSSDTIPNAPVNQRLSFRTGPNTRYVEMFTMPQSTQVEIISLEWGNGVPWVLCRFEYDGHAYYGYTGLKRFDLSEEDVTDSFFRYNAMRALYSTDVYSAPDGYGVKRGKLGANEIVCLLEFEGNYAFVEFYDASNSAPSRGWVFSEDLEDVGYFSETVMTGCSVYAGPSSSSEKIGKVGQYEIVAYLGTENGYDEIMFYSASAKDILSGYIWEENASML